MKKFLLCSALAMTGAAGQLMAQIDESSSWKEWASKTQTDRTFSIAWNSANFRDFITLDEGTIRLELQDASDYTTVRRLDSILLQLKKEIVFYKDSLDADPAGNVRIDYLQKHDAKYTQLRFKRYKPDGEIYVDRKGEVAKLKVEQDTINIILWVLNDSNINSEALVARRLPHSMMISLFLDNYKDMDKIIAQGDAVARIIDSFHAGLTAKNKARPYFYPSTSFYYNRAHSTRDYYVTKDVISGPYFKKMNGILDRNKTAHVHYRAKYDVLVNVGAGLVQNTIAPVGELGISYIDRWRRYLNNNYSFFSIYASGYYFFDNTGGNTLVHDNWFINAELGSTFNLDIAGLKVRGFSVGAGYLFLNKGDHFKGTTLKGMRDMPLVRGITLTPEIYVTDNWKQVYPGLTVKVFGKR